MSELSERLASLPLRVERYALEPLSFAVSGGWTRGTTVVRLFGAGHDGVGEDVTYHDEDWQAFQAWDRELPLSGETTLGEFSERLEGLELFPRAPTDPAARRYRRWAFESAALDLALRQAKTSLAAALGRTPRPVRFVLSLGLGEPPSMAPVRARLDRYPNLGLKLDPTPSWPAELIAELRETGAVGTVDLKGHYRGPFFGPPASAEFYARIVEGFPQAWIEDPELNAETRPVLAAHLQRVTWDYPLRTLGDLVGLEVEPRAVNVKPSRFGTLAELLRVYERCEARGIAMYGGGQFELGPGRGQIQLLASLFHPDGPNDVAPSGFNHAELAAGLPNAPLEPPAPAPGFRWPA